VRCQHLQDHLDHLKNHDIWAITDNFTDLRVCTNNSLFKCSELTNVLEIITGRPLGTLHNIVINGILSYLIVFLGVQFFSQPIPWRKKTRENMRFRVIFREKK